MPIRVMVVDDSAVMRGMLSEIINLHDDLEVVGVASDPLEARDGIKALHPDVLTLDVDMPRMDGLTFLERLMRLRPMPVVMVSSQTREHAEVTLRALELGAVDFIAKPAGGGQAGLAAFAEAIAEKIRAAAGARIGLAPGGGASRPAVPPVGLRREAQDRLVVIGASTGGTDAVKEVLVRMPENTPPILVVQHMPEVFTGMFANRMNEVCRIRVKEAEHGEPARPGHAYVAPGHSHMLAERRAGGYFIRLKQTDPVNRHRPSVDVLFHSAAASAGAGAIGIILTGMGMDGADGIRALKGAGAYNLAQNEPSCVVFGMPKAAIATGCIDKVAAPGDISRHLLEFLNRP